MPDNNSGTPSRHRLKHIRIEAFKSVATFAPPKRKIANSTPDREIHGLKLRHELAAAFLSAHALLQARDSTLQTGKPGVYIEVESAKDKKLPDLRWAREDIRFGALRVTDAGVELGTMFVPESAEGFLARKAEEYSQQDTPKGIPKHEDIFAPIETFRAGTIESLWTDQRAMPVESIESIWWECWCWEDRVTNLELAAKRLMLRASECRLHFPELVVIPVYGSREQMVRLLQHTDAIEELRRATDTPTFFTKTVKREQNRWVENLVERIIPPHSDCPAVCILDGGIARAHPLLSLALAAGDCLAVDSSWGSDDQDGHGTQMAGTVLYSDLSYPLADQRTIDLHYRLESVKFLPPSGLSSNEPTSYGAITQSAVVLPEIRAPLRPRLYCMAISNRDVSGERPTSWSAAVDQLCAGVMPGDEPDEHGNRPRRLFFVSAGNVPDSADPDEVSDLDEFPVEDPAQAWNALCVGGFTDKVDIDESDQLAGWKAVAPAGDHSPYSRISTDWDHSRTPIKPELVFEAGNRAISKSQTEIVAGVDSLSLLTTNKDFLHEPLTAFWATSAATAQAAGMAAEIMARHPELWPETVRALMVHSAEWTPAMRSRMRACKGRKKDRIALARHFGYGVPNLDRALASAENDLALVAQAQIQPFKRERKSDADGRMSRGQPSFNEVHYYKLPWPKQTLEALAEHDVALKITLSYFIEPSPGENAPVTPARYQSCGLRFELKRAEDTDAIFRKRINQLERGKEKLSAPSTDPKWTFGSQSMAAGSLHCDVWVGPAATLAARDLIAVYPTSGWWKHRTKQHRYDSHVHYALIVSITSSDADVQLYTEIASMIGIETTIPI